FKSGIEFGYDNPNNYFFYARFLNSRGKKPEAIEQLKQCLRLSPANMDARYLIMEILFDQARLEELRQTAEATLAIVPNDAKALAYIDAAENGHSRLQVAEGTAKKQNTADGYLNLSLEYYRAGQYEKCIEAAQNAVVLNPNYAA